MYYDESNDRIIDSRGNYFREKTQIDSLMFSLTLEKNAWNSNFLDITGLEKRIYLVNEQNKFLRPKTIWGKRNNILTLSETLLLVFKLREGNDSFLEKGENIYLVIKEFEQDIKITFALKYLEDNIKLK